MFRNLVYNSWCQTETSHYVTVRAVNILSVDWFGEFIDRPEGSLLKYVQYGRLFYLLVEQLVASTNLVKSQPIDRFGFWNQKDRFWNNETIWSLDLPVQRTIVSWITFHVVTGQLLKGFYI